MLFVFFLKIMFLGYVLISEKQAGTALISGLKFSNFISNKDNHTKFSASTQRYLLNCSFKFSLWNCPFFGGASQHG